MFSTETLQRFPMSRHPNNEWEFSDGITTAFCSEGNCHLQGYVYSFHEYGLTGNEYVLYRLNNWHVDRRKVSYFDNGSTWFGMATPFSDIYQDMVTGEWGYRLANSLTIVDTPGEWYYDANDKRLYMWAPDNKTPPAMLDFATTTMGTGA